MKILTPTDFSKSAEHAMQYAFHLARKLNASVQIYNFVGISVYASDVPIALPPEDELKKNAAEGVNKIKKAMMFRYPQIKIDTDIQTGINFPEDAILNEETISKANLIVMGTRGSGLRQLLGSNTAMVMENANCPVIAVPDDAPITPPTKIAFAVNYSSDDLPNILALIDQFAPFKPELTIVHILDKDADLAMADLELEGLLLRIRHERKGTKVKLEMIKNESPYIGLSGFLSKNHFDLLAVSMRKRSLFDKLFGRSLTKKMLYHTHLPIMAFHTR